MRARPARRTVAPRIVATVYVTPALPGFGRRHVPMRDGFAQLSAVLAAALMARQTTRPGFLELIDTLLWEEIR
ncbi:hypothetical protein [Salinarimonas soli]|uniref:Uncharacterized protein n=1 Tax=Salinarimonas soli TaxID=1638099 RepID=A0A5B2VFG8_9HYPH|nr:hypothetical protein [Salinarimonas soli]KAA2237714.1 hypothetical protein F0L46_08530 [Salinarimonas soli]